MTMLPQDNNHSHKTTAQRTPKRTEHVHGRLCGQQLVSQVADSSQSIIFDHRVLFCGAAVLMLLRKVP